jgi:hypothetical protein
MMNLEQYLGKQRHIIQGYMHDHEHAFLEGFLVPSKVIALASDELGLSIEKKGHCFTVPFHPNIHMFLDILRSRGWVWRNTVPQTVINPSKWIYHIVSSYDAKMYVHELQLP